MGKLNVTEWTPKYSSGEEIGRRQKISSHLFHCVAPNVRVPRQFSTPFRSYDSVLSLVQRSIVAPTSFLHSCSCSLCLGISDWLLLLEVGRFVPASVPGLLVHWSHLQHSSRLAKDNRHGKDNRQQRVQKHGADNCLQLYIGSMRWPILGASPKNCHWGTEFLLCTNKTASQDGQCLCQKFRDFMPPLWASARSKLKLAASQLL